MNAESTTGKLRGGILAAALLCLLVVLAWYRAPVADGLGKSVEFVEQLGPFGPVAFIAIYILATVLMMRKQPDTNR